MLQPKSSFVRPSTVEEQCEDQDKATVIEDSWFFFRMVCSLLRDRRKYDEAFRKMQLDPVYPYLNSMKGFNDRGGNVVGALAKPKRVTQVHRKEYFSLSRTAIARDLVKRAENALPSLMEVCNALAGSLGLEEVGIGPVKDVKAALQKAETKYEGDLLKVTDFCRGLLVVKDFPTLLALLELAREGFGSLIRRVKLSSLRKDSIPKPGGYRDCIINLELKDHICEIQISLWPMWEVIGVDGFRHYKHCVKYEIDSFGDPFEALAGLDRETMAALIVIAEKDVAAMPLEKLEWHNEKYILDYFAETGLFLHHGLYDWAETTLKALVKLRRKNPNIGPDHPETIMMYRYLEQALRAQEKTKEADKVALRISDNKELKKKDAIEEVQTLLEEWVVEPFEWILDPNKKKRENEIKRQQEVRVSKNAWKDIRGRHFKFLDEDTRDDTESKMHMC